MTGKNRNRFEWLLGIWTNSVYKTTASLPAKQAVTVGFSLACVASVSVWFRSKERPRNRILGFGRARNETRAKK